MRQAAKWRIFFQNDKRRIKLTVSRRVPYPLVFEEHDGSWSWSIERGEPFEADHEVLRNDDGYETRRDAQEAMQRAMLEIGLKLPSRAALQAASDPEEAVAVSEAESKPPSAKTTATSSDLPIPKWGVVYRGRLVALFQTREDARRYEKWRYEGKGRVRPATLTVSY